jgi:hypothetical protein
MGFANVLTNLSLICFASPWLDDLANDPLGPGSTVTKVLMFVALEHFIVGGKMLIDYFVSDMPAHVEEAKARDRNTLMHVKEDDWEPKMRVRREEAEGDRKAKRERDQRHKKSAVDALKYKPDPPALSFSDFRARVVQEDAERAKVSARRGSGAH